MSQSDDFANPYTIGGKRIQGGQPANNDVLSFNSTTNEWEYGPPAAGSPLTTKGDIFGFDTGDERIPVGADGEVLTADSASALGVKYATAGGSSLSELEFLQGKDAAGDLRNLVGNRSTTGLILSVTPPVSTTTVIVRGSVVNDSVGAPEWRVQVRVDAVVIEEYNLKNLITEPHFMQFTQSKGKQLIGDGAKVIDMNVSAISSSTVWGSLELYDL